MRLFPVMHFESQVGLKMVPAAAEQIHPSPIITVN